MQYQKDHLAKFPKQIEYALKNYQSHVFKASNFKNIIISGLGGSGIAGRIVKSIFADNCPLPVEIISDYNLPHYAGKGTLAILSSYSGNTEETLSMYEEAKRTGCTIIALTTGGKLEEQAKADGCMIYKAETGFQPRMALGFSLTYLLLFFAELVNDAEIKKALEAAVIELADTQKYIDEGEKFFTGFKHELPAKLVLVTDRLTYPIGVRFCQQVQENAKAEAFIHELPEANHNVIESYYGKLNSIFIFLNSHVNERTSMRFKFLNELLSRNSNHVYQMEMADRGLLSLLKTIYTLDWVSLWYADFKKVNSTEIKNINSLKDFLGKA